MPIRSYIEISKVRIYSLSTESPSSEIWMFLK
jgi:hypothetical protein